MSRITELRAVFQENLSTLVVSAFGLVAALAWNDAILNLFKTYFPEAAQIYTKFLYAVLVTVIAVLITFWLSRSESKEK